MTNYERGQWEAVEAVLFWLNEQEELSLRKTDIYAAVFAMRPIPKHRKRRVNGN